MSKASAAPRSPHVRIPFPIQNKNYSNMIRSLLLIAFLVVLVANNTYCQGVLDTEKYKDAELFAVKKGYDVAQRLEEIKAVEGQEITVFHVSGKQNKIKLSYTGVAEMSNNPNFSDKSKATLITVRTKDESGMVRVYFPLTNDSRYRIYLTEKMK
ncbi:hypothetical protein [Pontibacter chinhatensis]|nr:hypothetical protein [Pontibacter chinhatensis]